MSQIDRILEWRKTHPEWKQLRVAGMRSSILMKEAARAVARNPEYREKAKATRKLNPKLQGTPVHIRALNWIVRDPANRVHQFKNLALFIRTNPDLFSPEDVVWVKRGNGMNCRAMSGISSIRPTCRKVRPTWKGWTWVSIHERRFNDGNDLLDRIFK